MARIDQPDADELASHQKGIKMATVKAERVCHPQRLEALGQKISAGELAGFGKFEVKSCHGTKYQVANAKVRGRFFRNLERSISST